MAQRRESKFFRSGTVSPVSVLILNLQPKMCIPRMLQHNSTATDQASRQHINVFKRLYGYQRLSHFKQLKTFIHMRSSTQKHNKHGDKKGWSCWLLKDSSLSVALPANKTLLWNMMTFLFSTHKAPGIKPGKTGKFIKEHVLSVRRWSVHVSYKEWIKAHCDGSFRT